MESFLRLPGQSPCILLGVRRAGYELSEQEGLTGLPCNFSTSIVGPSAPLTCSNNTAVLYAQRGSIFLWSTGSIADSIVVSPTSTTTFTLVASDGLGCFDTSRFTVNVDRIPPPTPTILYFGRDSLCQGDSITLQSSSLANNQWLRDGELIPGGIQRFLGVVNSGNYAILTTGSNGCFSQSLGRAFVFSPIPLRPLISFNSVTGSYSSNYQNGNTWYLNGLPVSNNSSSNFIPSSASTGFVFVTVSQLGCTSIPSDTILITANALNFDQLNVDYSLYIAENYFQITSKSVQISSAVFSITGQQIKVIDLPAFSSFTTYLQSGVYILVDRKSLKRSKFVIK